MDVTHLPIRCKRAMPILVAKRKPVHPSGPTAQKMAATLIQSRIRAMAVRKIIQQKREAAHKATRIFFLVGGPGAGKSSYGKRLTNEFGAPATPADPLSHSRKHRFLSVGSFQSICWLRSDCPKGSELPKISFQTMLSTPRVCAQV